MIDYNGDILSHGAKNDRVRDEIRRDVADAESILGTASDATQLLLFEFSKLVTALSTASDIAAVNVAAASFSAVAQDFVASVDTGDTKLTYQQKNLDDVMTEIKTRSTAVSDVLIANQTGEI